MQQKKSSRSNSQLVLQNMLYSDSKLAGKLQLEKPSHLALAKHLTEKKAHFGSMNNLQSLAVTHQRNASQNLPTIKKKMQQFGPSRDTSLTKFRQPLMDVSMPMLTEI